jgi:hypothetical protein
MNDFILDGFEWSFSRVDSYIICPYAFYLNYIKELRKDDSFFGQYGRLVHELLEEYNKGLLFDFQLADEYEKRYDEYVTDEISSVTSNSYKRKGYSYFENFTDPGYKILACEEEYKFKVGKYNFIGKIDVETDNAVLDYKTKTGHVFIRYPKNREEIRTLEDGRYIELSNFKQLYTYCIPYYNKYNKYPEYLILEMVKMNDTYKLKFNYEDFINTQSWLINKIEEIYKTVEFTKNEDEFWCGQICGQRQNCDRNFNIKYEDYKC